jgi:hypothetical protein
MAADRGRNALPATSIPRARRLHGQRMDRERMLE